MKLKLKLGIVSVCLMYLLGCSIASDLVAPMATFGLGLYDANDYYSKDCMWYEPVQFSKQSKDILREFPELSKDLAQVARNNDIYKEVCK